MKKILFPTDFSENSLNAFRYALQLANKLPAEIITLHTYDGPEGFYQEYYDFLIENYTITEWNEFENYKSEVPKLKAIAEDHQLGHVKLSHMLERGTPVTSIVEIAAAEKVDYIVMGTKGARGLKEVFMGSLTEKIINQSLIPVLAVPAKCFYKPLKHIVFLCHYKSAEAKIFKQLIPLARLFDAQLDILQVQEHHREDEHEVMAQWKAMFPGLGIGFYMLTSNDYEGTVMDFIKLNKESLIAMPRHHKNFIDRIMAYSLSRELAFHSTIPLLTLPI